MLERILDGRGTFQDLKVIDQVCNNMALTSFCPLAVGAAPPVISATTEFRQEFETYIRRNPHADGTPKMLIAYPYLV